MKYCCSHSFTHIYIIRKIYEKCVDPTTILSEEKVVVFLIYVIKQRVVSLTEVIQQFYIKTARSYSFPASLDFAGPLRSASPSRSLHFNP